MISVPRLRIWLVALAALGQLTSTASPAEAGNTDAGSAAPSRPNVLLILTDDQGFGDFSVQGNPVVRTPNIDRLAAQSVSFANFYVSPVCTPSRAALMTGRHHLRSAGVTLMHPEEWTLGEMFAADAYRTGVFGKWNLGDNHPERPSDQGFHEALVLRGASISAISDPLHASYFDPVLWRNGVAERTSGYVTDVLTDAAMEFIARDPETPFFVYLPYNCPHNPLEAPEEYLERYARADVSAAAFPQAGRPLPRRVESATRRLYAMVEAIDDNIGRLLQHLDDLAIADDTIVVFLSDNGPQHPRWNAGLRGIKGSVYEGGLRTPCWIRWSRELARGRRVDTVAAHLDLAPTLLEACSVAPPPGVAFDGRSLWPLLVDPAAPWSERNLFFQWHVGDEPQPWRACAVRGPEYKLVQAVGTGTALLEGLRRFELFRPAQDPYELDDLSEREPEVVVELRAAYDTWFADVRETYCFELPRIDIGCAAENPLELTRQDLRGQVPGVFWNVNVLATGPYAVRCDFGSAPDPRELVFSIGALERRVPVPAEARDLTLSDIELPLGPRTLRAVLESKETVEPVWLLTLSR